MDENIQKHANKSRTEVRRTDNQVTDEAWIKDMLVKGAYGVLATTHQSQPYATPVNYIYIEADRALYFHGSHVGRTRANIALNPQVCFNVSLMGSLTPGMRISGFGVEYQSVTVFGAAAIVDDPDEKLRISLALMGKYFPDHIPGTDYPLPEPGELARTAIYKITIEEWSAKRRKVEEG